MHRAIIRDGLFVGLATGTYGISFGAVSVAAGLLVLRAPFLVVVAGAALTAALLRLLA